MNHEEADRVPIDLAGTSLTSISPRVVLRLLEKMGITRDDSSTDEEIDERILKEFQIDFRRVGSLLGSGDQPHPKKKGLMVDMWGIERAWTGTYWDIVHYPLRGATIDDLDHYPWPDPENWCNETLLDEFRTKAKNLYEKTDYVIVAEHPVYGIFELACWMCSFDDFLWRLVGDKEFVLKLFNIFLNLQKRFIKPYYLAVGDYIHLTTSGDDFGTQTGPFLSPKIFHEMVIPFISERIEFTKQFTNAYYWHHTCGSVFELIPDLINAGIEILNPIQPGAYKMEPERLKQYYGNQICFHGGFDTQHILPFGDKECIENEVKHVMETLKPNGGYIFSAAHNIQDDVPVENIIAMFEAAKKYSYYS